MKFRSYAAALAAATFWTAIPVSHVAHAQALGPQRQFIAIEPVYSRLSRDFGSGLDKKSLNGYGGRLWINLAPFSGPSSNLIGKTALALFSVYSPPGDGVSVVHYGAELDVHATNVPYGLILDPFVSLGGGVLRTRTTTGNAVGAMPGTVNKFAFTPGVGLRIPLLNHVQGRADFRDALVFGDQDGTSGNTRTSNNLEFLASVGLTF
ncbi:MAG: hypothetical protein ACR2KM_10705 [Gemmatimonadaceae bacterium]